MVFLLNHRELRQYITFKEKITRMAKLYICIALMNISNIYVTFCQC